MFKFTIERDVLLPSLLLVAGAVEKKHNMPILSNLLIRVKDDCLMLDATDTEIEFIARIPCSTIDEIGETTVPAKKIIDICRSLPDGSLLTVYYEKERLFIKAHKSRFTLTTLAPDEFPILEDENKELEFYLKPSALLHLLQATSFSMAQQDVRYYLNGLLLDMQKEHITAVTTDGHRLAICEEKIETLLPDKKIILPRKGVAELTRLLSDLTEEKVLVSVTKNHFYLQTAQYTFITKLIEGRFPSYQKVIPLNNNKLVIVDRDELKKCLTRVSILANEKYRAVSLTMSACKLTIAANNQEKEEAFEEMEADTQGEEMKIGFNASYLLDVLNHLPQGQVKLSFYDMSSCMLVESVTEQHAKYIIMPMKI